MTKAPAQRELFFLLDGVFAVWYPCPEAHAKRVILSEAKNLIMFHKIP